MNAGNKENNFSYKQLQANTSPDFFLGLFLVIVSDGFG